MKVPMQHWELNDYTKVHSIVISNFIHQFRELSRLDPSNPLVESGREIMQSLIGGLPANQNKPSMP